MDFNEGDLVEATKGEQVIRGRVIRPGTTDRLALTVLEESPVNSPFTRWLEDHGWTLRTVEKAAPALPTAEGAYVGKYGYDVWTITSFHGLRCVENSSSNPAKYAPFTRLEPVADTAKKVLDRFREVSNASFIRFEDALKSVRAEFGVTDD